MPICKLPGKMTYSANTYWTFWMLTVTNPQQNSSVMHLPTDPDLKAEIYLYGITLVSVYRELT